MANLKQVLTKEEADKVAGILEEYFPWLNTEDEANGGDTVDNVSELYDDVKRVIES